MVWWVRKSIIPGLSQPGAAALCTTPLYEKDLNTRYPVPYLQHGSFEYETGWPGQGTAGLIPDIPYPLPEWTG